MAQRLADFLFDAFDLEGPTVVQQLGLSGQEPITPVIMYEVQECLFSTPDEARKWLLREEFHKALKDHHPSHETEVISDFIRWIEDLAVNDGKMTKSQSTILKYVRGIFE